MASSQDTTLQNLIINDVDSESTLEDMVTNNQIQPNQLYATPDETDGFISLPIGTIFPSAIPQTSSAFHLLDGSTISKTGIYSQFADLLDDLVNAGYNISCTQAQFDSDVSTYGQCGKFVIGTDTIRLPKITKFIEGLSNITNIGTSFQAGLPNITGTLSRAYGEANTSGSSGAIQNSTSTGNYKNGFSTAWLTGGWTLDASRSSSVYGRSSTVQPQSTAYPYYIVLANSYKTDLQVNIDQVASDLALKLDKYSAQSVTQLYSGDCNNQNTRSLAEAFTNFMFIVVCAKWSGMGSDCLTIPYTVAQNASSSNERLVLSTDSAWASVYFPSTTTFVNLDRYGSSVFIQIYGVGRRS